MLVVPLYFLAPDILMPLILFHVGIIVQTELIYCQCKAVILQFISMVAYLHTISHPWVYPAMIHITP
jgi:hypothetical protein